nr:MAG TPA: hypothetical protein [Caudoviricetes sp.]
MLIFIYRQGKQPKARTLISAIKPISLDPNGLCELH